MSRRRDPQPAKRGIALAATLAALAVAAALPPSAAATFHLMSVREVYPGSAAQPDSEYVELQMYASGQEFVKGHSILTYGAGGALTGTNTFGSDVANGANQSTIVIATPAAEAQFGIAADAPMSAGLSPAGGAVCWDSLDCVAWGSFSGTTPSPTGAPADPSGIPDGMALRRSIAAGCATLFEGTDDTDSSSADFFDAFPSPRPNSVAPSEHGCGSGGGGGGGGGNAGGGGGAQKPLPGRPQTKIVRGPRRRTQDRTPTFRFRANEPSRYQCKIDRRRWRPCRSPYTTPRLGYGRHVFRVRARDRSGKVDRTPATFRFRVVRIHHRFHVVRRHHR